MPQAFNSVVLEELERDHPLWRWSFIDLNSGKSGITQYASPLQIN